jgi:regulatory protein
MGERPAEVNPADLKDAALRLLARREHSWRELSQKLTRRGWPADLIEQVLADLAEQGLQSDQRYAESYARSRAAKAYGPVRIRAEMAERGLDRGQIEQALGTLDIDWLESAAGWYQRRYGGEPVTDFREKSRRQQALARRGFPHDLIRQLTD